MCLHTAVVFAVTNLAEDLRFLLIHGVALPEQPQGAPSGIVECDAGRVAAAEQRTETQFASNGNVVFNFVAEANIVGGVAKPFREIRTSLIALRSGLLVPGDRQLAILRHTNAELVGAAKGVLPLQPALLCARLE